MHSTLHELDSMAALCGRLRLLPAEGASEQQLLAPLCEAIGAEAAAYRHLVLTGGEVRIANIGNVGIPATVTEAYRQHFHRYDPALALLRNPSQAPALIDTSTPVRERQFQHYRRAFLEPHGLHQHLGFLLRDDSGQCAWVFNFHRHRRNAEFDALSHARARLIYNVLQGQAALLSSTQTTSLAISHPLLSARELAVARAVVQGFTNKQIAHTHDISVRTVENHLRGIYRKLNIHTRTQLGALLHSH
jgi:DNA-binding CsgD family transcriptional regulator